MGALHATIEEFAAEGYTHVECFCLGLHGGKDIRNNHINEMQSS
jgi:hypothetical protein